MKTIIFGFLVGLSIEAAAIRTVTIEGITLPLHSKEVVPQEEAAAIAETNKIFGDYLKEQYAKPSHDSGSGLDITGGRRGVHPKAHGCLKGQLVVDENLPSELQAGIFQNGKKYDVITRFSNAGPRANNHDKTSDARGIGIKVLGVEGEALLQQGPNTYGVTQDFTLNSSDAFFADSVKTYADFMRIALIETTDFTAASRKHALGLLFSPQYKLGWRVLKAFGKMKNLNPTNPVSLNYFSIAPFQHGAGENSAIVKYIIKPCGGAWREPINELDQHFLRRNLKRYMSQKEACFDFSVQVRDSEELEIEDLTKPWEEKDAPAIKIARIILPPQELMDEMVCEKIVINPWNTLPEHKPLGGINRIRLSGYLQSIENRKHSTGH